jgi:uncharacterized protein (TIGR00369 family)
MDFPVFDDQFDPAIFIKFMSKRGHNGLLGSRYHAHGPDWCALELPWRAELASDAETGILASGPIFTLMDMATSMSIWLKRRQFEPQATLDLRIDYLRPAEPGKTVVGRGECYHVARSVAFVRGQAHDGDPVRPIAHVAGTYFFTGRGA